MTLNELKGKYARLSNEIDALAGESGPHEARLQRLMNDLDEVHRQLSELRQRTFAAPTLRDAVQRPEPGLRHSPSEFVTVQLSLAG
jgi:uncharacterized protein involved in exopolysaccharide biosynthesis